LYKALTCRGASPDSPPEGGSCCTARYSADTSAKWKVGIISQKIWEIFWKIFSIWFSHNRESNTRFFDFYFPQSTLGFYSKVKKNDFPRHSECAGHLVLIEKSLM